MDASRKVAAALLAGLLSAAAAGQTIGSGETARKHRVPVQDRSAGEIAQAEAAIEKKDYAAAENQLKKTTAAHPLNYRAWYDLGYLYTLTNRPVDAIRAYRSSVEAKPDVFESNLNLGLALAAEGDAEAAKYLQAATGLKPETHAADSLYHAWLALGRVQAKSKPEAAMEAFQQAAKLKPGDAEPHFYAGTLLEKRKNYAGAAGELEKAAAIAPRDAEIAAALANVYMEGRDFGRAEAALRKYLELDPKSATAHLQLGRVLAAEGKADAAAGEYEAAGKIAPNDPEVGREMARMYLDAGKYAEAAAAYQGLVQQSPGDAELHYALAQAQLHMKDFVGAQNTLAKVVQLKPDFAPAYSDLALATSENKRYDLTVKALDLRAKLAPETPGTLFLRATALDHLRDYKNAALAYKQFLATAEGKYPDQEWQARHRLIAIDPEKKKR